MRLLGLGFAAVLLCLGPIRLASGADVLILTDAKTSKMGSMPDEVNRLFGSAAKVMNPSADSANFLAALPSAKLLIADNLMTIQTPTSAETALLALNRDAIMAWIKKGGYLVLWQIDAPGGVLPSFLPYQTAYSDDDDSRLMFADVDSPLLDGVRGKIVRLPGCAGDAIKDCAPEWQVLCTSGVGKHMLAASYGEGAICLAQFRDSFSFNDHYSRLMARNFLTWAGFTMPRMARAPAQINIEAEDMQGPWREQTNIPGYQGRGFKCANIQGKVAPDPLTTSVRIDTPGRYCVWVRAYEGDNQDRSFRILIAGTAFAPTHTEKNGERYTWQCAGEIDLTKGEQEVKVQDVGPDYESVDAITLTNDLTYDPQADDMALSAYGADAQAGRIPLEYILQRTRILEGTHPIPKSKDEWEARRKDYLPKLRKALGLEPFPPRTPLNVKTYGTLQKSGYSVELMTYEARPGEIVTANLYMPDGMKSGEKRPAVICPVGHFALAKMEPIVQSRCIGLAKLGFIVLCYDAIGQGERTVAGNDHDESLRELPSGHMNLSYMVWDTMRGIDYLISRPDVEADKIGCTGCSGGGLNTIYAAAIDDRIACSGVVAFYYSWPEFLSWDMWHCACNHVPGTIELGTMRDLAALTIPRSQIVISMIRDEIFPIAGARTEYKQLEQVYKLYGLGDRVAYAEADTTHGYPQPAREAMYGFFVKHLMGKGDGKPIPEPQLDLETDPYTRIQVYGGNNVPSTSETFQSMAKAATAEKIAALPAPDKADLRSIRTRLVTTLNVPAKPEPSGRLIRTVDYHGTRALVSITDCGDHCRVPTVFFPASGDGPHPVLVYVKEGETATNVARTLVPMAHAKGVSVIWVDCRGWGETSHTEGVIARQSIYLDEPMVGQWVRDLWGAIGYFADRPEVDAKHITIYGSGLKGSLIALYATALDDGIVGAAVDACPASYMDAFDNVGITHVMAVPDVLSVADIAQTTGLIAPRKLWLGLYEGSSADRLGSWREKVTQSGGKITAGTELAPQAAVDYLAK